MLKVAALIGATVDLKLLMAVQNLDEQEIINQLSEAIDQEIIIPENNYYEFYLRKRDGLSDLPMTAFSRLVKP